MRFGNETNKTSTRAQRDHAGGGDGLAARRSRCVAGSSCVEALQILPWPLRLTALGCDPRDPPPENDRSHWHASWPRAVALQAELYRVAGPPPRKLKRPD